MDLPLILEEAVESGPVLGKETIPDTADRHDTGEPVADELVDLAAFLMDRKQIRHVLVEDPEHRLVGVISYRTLLRLIAHRGVSGLDENLAARGSASRVAVQASSPARCACGSWAGALPR